MFDSDGNLDVFERFQVDHNLPKYQQPSLATTTTATGSSLIVNRFGDSDGEAMSEDDYRVRYQTRLRSRRRGPFTVTASTTLMVPEQPPPLTWFQRVLVWMLFKVSPRGNALVVRHMTEDPGPTPGLGPPEITVHEFFSSIKDSQSQLEVVDGRARGYEAALDRARKSGQTALTEQLESGIEAVRAETQLLAMGMDRVLTEATLVEFVKKSPKGLRLDWIKNFTRMVPKDVLESKVECDERHIFDNYVILHYDPDAKSWAQTEAERSAKADPILFGVVEGRRLLYFIGEWIDDYCDLSLDQIADVLYEGMDVRPSEATDRLEPRDYGTGVQPVEV
jgi:hypothetical protein